MTTRALLLAAARHLNVPDVTLTARSVRALAGALLPALLRASTPAQERFAAWNAENPAGAWGLAPAALAEMITHRVHYFGERAMLPIVVEALSRVSPAVREHVLERVAILGIGRRLRGLCTPARFVDRDGRPFEYLAVVTGQSDAAIRRTTWHELGHAWLLPSPTSESRAIEEVAHDSLLALAERESWPGLAHYRESTSAEEMLAQALAACWGLA